MGAAQFLLVEKFVAPKARHYLLEWFHSTFIRMTAQAGNLFPGIAKKLLILPFGGMRRGCCLARLHILELDWQENRPVVADNIRLSRAAVPFRAAGGAPEGGYARAVR